MKRHGHQYCFCRRRLIYNTGVNLLAHAFLADGVPDRIVGQLCGDFVRGSDLSAYPPLIQSGIRCHRAVDTFTDRHAENLAARNLFEAPYRRFAGIAVDVIYDHFLAQDWDSYSDVPLQEYTALVSDSLAARHDILPDGLRRFKELLDVEDTLYRNLQRDHIDLTLQRIAGRRRSFAALATIAPVVRAQEPALRSSFERFFPQLLDYTRKWQKSAQQISPTGR